MSEIWKVCKPDADQLSEIRIVQISDTPVYYHRKIILNGCNQIIFFLDIKKTKVHYTSTLSAATSIWTNEGPRAFYHGLTPQMISMVPYSALAFGFYEFFTQTCYRANLNTFTNSEDGQRYLGFYSKCLCSAMSGVLAKTTTYPLDTVRKRMQVQGFELGRLGMGETPKYSGMKDCFAKIFTAEGYRGFFKGLVPGNLKAALSTLLYFQMYEIFKHQIALLRQQQDQKRSGI